LDTSRDFQTFPLDSTVPPNLHEVAVTSNGASAVARVGCLQTGAVALVLGRGGCNYWPLKEGNVPSHEWRLCLAIWQKEGKKRAKMGLSWTALSSL